MTKLSELPAAVCAHDGLPIVFDYESGEWRHEGSSKGGCPQNKYKPIIVKWPRKR